MSNQDLGEAILDLGHLVRFCCESGDRAMHLRDSDERLWTVDRDELNDALASLEESMKVMRDTLKSISPAELRGYLPEAMARVAEMRERLDQLVEDILEVLNMH